jgi:hypothetical protein
VVVGSFFHRLFHIPSHIFQSISPISKKLEAIIHNMKLLIISFLFTQYIYDGNNSAQAFSTGAGGCDTGGAVGGPHLVSPTTGPLSTGSFQVLLDGTTPLLPDTPTSITASQLYTLSIVPSAGATFRGALFRVAGTGVTLLPGTNAQVAVACTDVAGVTHTSNDLKTDFKATVQVDGTASTIVDVTVVVANSATAGSTYYYSQFLLQPTDAATTPMATPIATPVAEPTTVVPAPTVAEPVAIPTVAPVAAVVPTDVPVSIVEPTATPLAVAGPTQTPAVQPTSFAPVMEPTQTAAPSAKVTMESDAPSNGYLNMTDSNSTAPVSSPVRVPTMVTAPTPSGPSSFAAMKFFPARNPLLMLVTVVVVAFF